MSLTEISILFLTFMAPFVGGMIVYFRNKMVAGKSKPHTKKRILKLVVINMLIMLIITIPLITVYYDVYLNTPNFGTFSFPSLAFPVVILLTFYGAGVYITSIILENFTPQSLTKATAFKTQFIATHLFHGPLSHILVFSGWIFAFLILVFLEASFGRSYTTPNILMLASGAFVGTGYAIGQIYNRTFLFQMLSGLIAFGIFSTSTLLGIDFLKYSTTSFFSTFIITFNFTILVYLLYLLIKKRRIHWYMD